jgi:hypothetical protein
MREKQCDYFENSRPRGPIFSGYAARNPHEFEGYGEDCWGLSAGDGPGARTLQLNGRTRRFFGYVARGVPYGPGDGTLLPSTILGSLAFAPEIVLPAIRHVLARYPQTAKEYRLLNGFNPTMPGTSSQYWTSDSHFGLDQGIIVLMIENYRSQLIWNLMRQCRHVRLGLHHAGFRGGWL